ncbi:MAG: hypothetical protein GQE15_30085 [Archangiaceae bacterium]|nr:hypothetical protein [Archangiaceae bacterium]
MLLERALEAGAFMLRLAETLTPYAVVADSQGTPSLVSVDAHSADPDELEMQLVGALQADARDGVIRGAAWAYTIDVKTPDYAGPALKVYVDVSGEQPFVAYTPYTYSAGEAADLGDTHRLDAEASVLFASVTGKKKPVKAKKKPTKPAKAPKKKPTKKASSKGKR